MSVVAVWVSFALEGHEIIYGTSGILFNKNMVLLTGTALIPLVHEEEWISQFVNSSSSKLEANSYIQKISFRIHVEPPGRNENYESSTPLSCEGRAVAVWQCPLVSLSIKKLFSHWTVGHIKVENKSWDLSSDVTVLLKELMSIFILVECRNKRDLKQNIKTNKSDDVMLVLFNLLSSLQEANRGQEVEVVSTPFGHKHFMNSLSRGVISSAVGYEKCIILTDARTVSGCEGGPIFLRKTQKRGELIGIVICPLTWWRGEWVGLTVGINLLPVIKELLRLEKDISFLKKTSNSLHSDSSSFRFIDESVVLVRSKDSWGSGVILHGTSGVIVTCSHVVKNDKLVSIFHMNNQRSADVIFSSQNDVAYDLAVVKIRHSCGDMKEVQFAEKPAKLGQTVIAAGFPFFSEEDDVHIRPSIVIGCISRVNSYMIQTTCCIQSGFSGGPLFREGKLIGIITSNAMSSGALYPHINFIIPSSVFKEPIMKYIRTNDIRSLKELETSNLQIQYLWKLHNSKL